jgi:hypothetical protein
MARCCLYKYRGADSDPRPDGPPGTYFVICTTGTDCPPMTMVGADLQMSWLTEDCSHCTVPDGLPVPPKVDHRNITGTTTYKLAIRPFHPRPDGINEAENLTWYGNTTPVSFRNGTRETWNDLHVTVKPLLPKGTIAGVTVTKISNGHPAPAQSSTGKSDASGAATADFKLNPEIAPGDGFEIKFQTPGPLGPPVPTEVELVIRPTRDGKTVG